MPATVKFSQDVLRTVYCHSKSGLLTTWHMSLNGSSLCKKKKAVAYNCQAPECIIVKLELGVKYTKTIQLNYTMGHSGYIKF